MPQPDASEIGAAIERMRKRANVTQKQMAEVTGVDQSTISSWCRGEYWPAVWALPIFERLCGARLGHILRKLGDFVDDDEVDLEIAIDQAKDLPDAIDRHALAMLYSVFRERRAE